MVDRRQVTLTLYPGRLACRSACFVLSSPPKFICVLLSDHGSLVYSIYTIVHRVYF
jgi:hypothetical protein